MTGAHPVSVPTGPTNRTEPPGSPLVRSDREQNASLMVSSWYHADMGMTLRTTEAQTEALRRQAEAEGRSMQQVALAAIDEYIARRQHKARVAESSRFGVAHYAEALKTLGEI